MRYLIPLVALAIASCSTGPTVIHRPDGAVIVSLGVSIFEKSKAEAATVEGHGWKLAYSKDGKDQTVVAATGIKAWASVASIAAAADGLNKGEAIREKGMTSRTISSDSVKKAEIAGDVTKATFIPIPE